jgi:HD-GYP domain-containing protein (c-di-GMP phosphodiesterase class II)
MGIAGEALEHLVNGARLHDLGKIGIREEILNKPGSLTPEEYKHIQTHPGIGAEIISQMEAYRHLVPMVKFHHERIDGNGYPDRLRGDQIPLCSRIISVADAFDAMTSDRPYRRARSIEEALVIIRKVTGTQLDPTCVAAFLALQAEAPVSQALG